jgi:hypothetical protein
MMQWSAGYCTGPDGSCVSGRRLWLAHDYNITLCAIKDKALTRAQPPLVTTVPSLPALPAGEVTLTGKVLPIGGVKEKTLAARRSGVKHILFPEGNRRDWDELTEVSHPVVSMAEGFIRREARPVPLGQPARLGKAAGAEACLDHAMITGCAPPAGW